ncbi:MAG: trypsin-like peptidase domain-containing protein [Oscillospiraceae bacterium]|nr:trypsin-like peptidase domain-containing protein [Oscillospiraceae bacterium]
MDPYNQNYENLFNSEPPKPEAEPPAEEYAYDTTSAGADAHIGPNTAPVGADAHIGSETAPVGADAHIGLEAAPVGADAYIGPTADDQPVYHTEPEQPAYQNSYYASGPVYTPRPAQTTPAQRPSAEHKAPEKKQKQRSGGFWKKAVALALVCALLGGAAGFGGALLANKLQSGRSSSSKVSTAVQLATPRESTELNVVTVDSGKLMTASQVYQNNVNSTVGITTEITTNWWGYQSTSAAAGSGFILTEDGYILTNEHVIEDANTITVAMYDGSTYAATLVGYDVNNDIAVLKIDAKGLTPVVLGDSDALSVGEDVVAIGNPLGELTFSLTKGTVSALNRSVTLSSNVTMNLIQTDTAINSGNSGGALFNMYGEVVGITNAKYSSSSYSGQASIDNIGFAIPINSVRDIVTSIIEKGYISRPYIGVSVANVSEESQSYGMPQGAAIRSVEQNSPAEKAGLQANDIVTAINGETISSFDDLKNRVSASEPGDELAFTVYRKGETLTITVVVGEKTQDALPSSQSESSQQQGQTQDPWGGSGQSIDPWGGSGQGIDPWGGSGQGSGTFPFGWGYGG